MRKTIVVILLFIGTLANAETLSWNIVNTYTDGQVISKPVTYNVYDNAYHATNPIATGVSGASWFITNKGSNVTHGFEVSATVDNVTGGKSARLGWTSPPLSPEVPGGLRVQ